MAVLDAATTRPREGGPSFSLQHRLTRVVWGVVWIIAAAWTPPFMRGWRRMILEAFGARLAPGAMVYGSARIWYPANLTMAKGSCIGRNTTVYSMGPITLGEYALVSQGAHLCAGTHDIEDEHFQLRARPIVIGAHTWVAAEAFVGPGVTIGEGAVLGARGVAMRDLDPWTVYSGNPAVAIRTRKHISQS